MFSPPNMRLMPPTGSIQVLPSQTKPGETPVLPLSSNANTDKPVKQEYQEAYSKALQMQAQLFQEKQQVVTYNFEGFTPVDQIEEVKNLPKPGEAPAKEPKERFNKPVEEKQETKEEKGGQKSHREKGDNNKSKGNKPHKKKIYNY